VIDLLPSKPTFHALLVAVTQAVRSAVRRIQLIALKPVPHYSRVGLYLQANFAVVVLVWFEYRPSWTPQGPGVAMAFLAVAATIMAVRGPDSTRIEGVLWVAAAFCLFAAEMHSITVERRAHDVEQSELRSREDATRREQTESFAKLVRDGQHLFSALDEEKALTAKNLEHITGGDGYCWLVPISPLPVGLGGDPEHQGNNYWQLGLKNSGKVMLPTCNFRFMPFPTEKERKETVAPTPEFLFYPFVNVPIMGRRYYRYTSYFIKGDQIYSGVIETPTREFIEVIKFEASPNDPTRFSPSCMVSTTSGKILEKDCNPQ
jgi:hypothetical protein